MSITPEELLEEMQQALANAREPEPEDDPGLTSEEWAEQWGVGVSTARTQLRSLYKQGLIEVGKRSGIGMDGKRYRAPVYRAIGEN